MNIGHANAMPAPTWHYLHMNDVDIPVPDGLAAKPAVTTAITDAAIAPAGTFEFSLAMLQRWWEVRHPGPGGSRDTQGDAATSPDADAGTDADAAYGGTALSRYQARADAALAANSLESSFETGVGEQAAAFLSQAAGEPIVISADEGQTVDARITVMGVDGAISAAAIDVVAGMDSTVNLDIVVDSPDAPLAATGSTGTTLRVVAGFGARVNVKRVQTLDAGFHDIDDMGFVAADNARIQVGQIVLGAGRTYTGLACDLRGRAAKADIDVRYLGHGGQNHDLNYTVRHHGPESECDIQANGVLAGSSQKTLRGTIDLVRGCKGAAGNERETVLLVDPDVRNRTVPVILCNEDDVAGNHGATIGHVNAEQLHYLQSRGLTRQQVEALFLEASFDYAASQAPTEQCAAGVERLARAVLGHGVLLRDDGDDGAADSMAPMTRG